MAGLAAGAAVLCAAALADYTALKIHLDAGPFMYTGADCAGTVAAGSVPSPTDPTAGLSAWPTLGGVPAHNLLLSAAPTPGDPLAASWTFQTNGPVVMAPSVVNGIAYLGSMDGCVYAVDVATGRLLWSFGADNQVMSQPIVENGEVIFGSGNKGMGRLPSGGLVRGTGESGIYALDATTGRELWFVQTLGEDMPTPAYQNGVVYEATGGKVFYAVDAATGQQLWQIPVGSYVSMSSPTLAGSIAVFGGALPYQLIGVNVETHQVAWQVPLPQAHGGVDDISPSIADGIAYVQVPEGKYAPRIVEMAIRASDGAVLWQRTLGTDRLNLVQRALGMGTIGAHDGEEAGVATIQNGVLYVGSPGLHGLWALDASTGQPVWARPAAIPAGVRTAPAIDGGTLYATSDRSLFAVAVATGRVVGQKALGPFREGTGIMIPCATPSPTVVGDTVLVGSGTDAAAIEAVPLAALGGTGAVPGGGSG